MKMFAETFFNGSSSFANITVFTFIAENLVYNIFTATCDPGITLVNSFIHVFIYTVYEVVIIAWTSLTFFVIALFKQVLLLIATKNNKKILLLELVSFDLKRKTLRACSNLAQYLFEGKHRISVKDDKSVKDRKREYCAVLARKLIEVVAKEHPTILKAENEKLKIVRVDCLASKHRAPTRWNVLVSEIHKLEAAGSEEAKAIIAKINATSNEINNM
ncbi:hypothetical protein DdX_04697 [Ditylenchus destructor]|uniref:Uncharacterized protein n=1 Tax=Ditylenchus destructor TaxID=166010 RepID=A0AAD4NCX1_9BILA|nr:hypothetical protein DdX_04697 [Ditylenchus destructor]